MPAQHLGQRIEEYAMRSLWKAILLGPFLNTSSHLTMKLQRLCFKIIYYLFTVDQIKFVEDSQ